LKKLTCNIGDKFGDWIVIDNNSITKNSHTYVKVKCKCNKEQLTCLSDLINKRTFGCRKCGVERRRNIKINIGDKYKHWTVIGGPRIYNECLQYLIQCDCKETRWIQPNELINPNRCFQCQNCAGKERGEIATLKNGKIGKLTIDKYTRLKRNASIRHMDFNVSMEYLWNLFVYQNGTCFITGDNLYDINKSSLDRLDSKKGYIEGNVQWVTKQANLSKHIMTMPELLDFCQKVINNFNKK